MKIQTKCYALLLFALVLCQNHYAQVCDVPDNINQLDANDVFGDNAEYGQSFTATCNGTLKSIRVYTNEITQAVTGQLKIYNEVPFTGPDPSWVPINGTNGQAINWSVSTNETMQTIELTNPIPVTSGEDYTFIIEGTIGKVSYGILDSFDDSSLDYTGGFLFGRFPNATITCYTNRDLKFEVNYTDVIQPVANCQNAIIELDINGEANLVASQVNNGSSGGVVAFQLSQEFFTCDDIGSNTVTLTVFDGASNSDSCQAIVTVIDNFPPVNETCPSNITIEDCNDAVVTYDIPTFSDNTDTCELTVELAEGLASGSTFPVNETTTVTYRATDLVGNSTDCSFTVFVGDTTSPTLDGLPENQTVDVSGTNCEGLIPNYNLMASDNCGGAVTITQTEGVSGTGPFPLGVTTNTFEIEDAAGNITTESFTVTVEDNQAPIFDTCLSDETYYIVSGQSSGVITYATPTASDYCGNVTVTQTEGLASGSTFPVGDTAMEFTATDEAGNSTTCSFMITVVASTPLIITGVMNDGSNASIELYALNNIADLSTYSIGVSRGGDGSDGSEFSLSGSATAGQFIYLAYRTGQFEDFFGFAPDFGIGFSFELWPTTAAVELFADISGTPTLIDVFGDVNEDGVGAVWNYSTGWAYRVNNTPPTNVWDPNNWRLPGFGTYDYNEGTTNDTSPIPYPIGTYGMPYGTTPPVAVCTDFEVTIESGFLPITPEMLDGGSSDDTGIVVMTIDDNQLSCIDEGLTPVSLTVYDQAGNRTTCVSNITVNLADSQVVCKDFSISLDLNGEATIVPSNIREDFLGPCTGEDSQFFLSYTEPSENLFLFEGETTISSPTDDIIGNGSDQYYQEISFTVPTSGEYVPNISFLPSGPDQSLFAIISDVPVAPNTGDITLRPGFIDFAVYEPVNEFVGTQSGNDAISLNSGTTYYMQIVILNQDFTPAIGSFNGFIFDGDLLQFYSYTEADLGENTLYLVSLDDIGRVSYCESTVTVTENPALPIKISEYQPVVLGTDQSIEISGTPGELFEGAFVVIQGNTDTGQIGKVTDFTSFTGTFDDNGLIVTMIPNLTNPSNTVVLTSAFIGDTSTDIDSNNDGEVDDLSAFGNILDAIGVNDGGVCCPEDVYYGTKLGGINLPNTGSNLSLVFRERSTGEAFVINGVTGDIFNESGVVVDALDFDAIPDENGSFGDINPALLATGLDDFFVTTWKTDNTGTSSSTSITIPTFPGASYSYQIDWTYDGVTFNAEDTYVTGDITHDYGTAGTYVVAIRGRFPRIYFNDGGDEHKILTIEQWGSNPWTSMEQAFEGCVNLDITNINIDTPDLSNVTSLYEIFSGANAFNGDVTNWDVSNVEIFDYMFEECYAFNQPVGG